MLNLLCWISDKAEYVSINDISSINLKDDGTANIIFMSGRLIELIVVADVTFLLATMVIYTELYTSDTLLPEIVIVGGNSGITLSALGILRDSNVSARGGEGGSCNFDLDFIEEADWTQLLADASHADHEATEVAHHFHNIERWLGAAADATGEIHVADVGGVLPFVMTSGNNDWGEWFQIAGSEDTPIIDGMTKIDAHRILFSDIDNDGNKQVTKIQIGGGTSGANALETGSYSEFYVSIEKNGKQIPIDLMMPRFDASTKGWIRCLVIGQDAIDIDFYIGLHEYLT